MTSKWWIKSVALVFVLSMGMVRAGTYENDFSDAEPGDVPVDMLVMDGGFAVIEHGGNRVLELPGSPLETFGVLFGGSARQGVDVRLRVHSTRSGRRYPVFGVSAGGVSGYRLQVAPAKGVLELVKNERPVSSVDWTWRSGVWTHLRLSIEPAAGDRWTILGKAWQEGSGEPSDWMLSVEVADQPPNGKAGLWGKPFAGTAIRFDDIRVEIRE